MDTPCLLGKNWVIHRRTRRIVEKYGESVICYSPKKYAEIRAKCTCDSCNNRYEMWADKQAELEGMGWEGHEAELEKST